MTSRISAVLIAVALLVPQSAFSAGFLEALTQYKKGNMKYGKLEIHPFASIVEKYDDNIYLTPENNPNGTPALGYGSGVRGSAITDVSGGVDLKLPLTDMHKFEAGYQAQGLIYSNDPSANNAINQKADAAYMYSGPMGISAKAFDEYVNTSDPATSELTQRAKRWQNTGGFNGEYAPKGGMFFAGVQGTQVTHKYISDPNLGSLLNRYEQTGGGRAGYQLQPKTRVYASYDRQIIHYTVLDRVASSNRKNSKAHLINGGIEGQILPKLKGQIQGGVIMRHYDEASEDRVGNKNDWIVDTNLVYKPLERTEIALGVNRGLREATFGINRYYVGTGATLRVKHKLPYKLSANTSGGWGMDKYPQATDSNGVAASGAGARQRRDNIYTGSAGLDYELQEWIALTASFTHRAKFSNFSEKFNYKDNITSAGVKMTF